MKRYVLRLVFAFFTLALSTTLRAQSYIAVSYNCENLFDIRHDSLKNDYEFLPDGERHWTFRRYWQKLNDLSRVILQTGGQGEEWTLPDLAALTEIENDSVADALTHRSLLRNGGYRYIITNSLDERGIDVALLYNSLRMKKLQHETIRIPEINGQRRTRDILYAAFTTSRNDTLHAFVVHAPSRSGGQGHTDSYRQAVARTLVAKVDSIRSNGEQPIIIMGDFNDYTYNKSVKIIKEAGFNDISESATGLYHPEEVKGTYYFQRTWNSLDHIFISPMIKPGKCFIYDADWLLEKDSQNIVRPRRTYLGPHYHGGVSDHLPIVLHFQISNDTHSPNGKQP